MAQLLENTFECQQMHTPQSPATLTHRDTHGPNEVLDHCSGGFPPLLLKNVHNLERKGAFYKLAALGNFPSVLSGLVMGGAHISLPSLSPPLS